MTIQPINLPGKIICLTEETTETLYLLGEQDRIAGITIYTVRPPEAAQQKPKLASFLDADVEKIVEMKPDLVIGFSDVQATLASKLIKAGLNVLIFNQRSVEEILEVVLMTGTLVGAQGKAMDLVDSLRKQLKEIAEETANAVIRPKVYFEEWDKPRISCIRWVSELISIAGGEDVFSDLSINPDAKGRTINDDKEIITRNPDIYIASWCGKPFNRKTLLSRQGWESINAIKNDEIYEIDSSIILQPGPAALTDGIKELKRIVSGWKEKNQ
jgi:iron complex transport system substrate-binding protein